MEEEREQKKRLKEKDGKSTSSRALQKLMAGSDATSDVADVNLFERFDKLQAQNPVNIIAAFQAKAILEGIFMYK